MITTLLTALFFIIAPSPSATATTAAATSAPAPVSDGIRPLCIDSVEPLCI